MSSDCHDKKLRIKINCGARLFIKVKNNLTQWLYFSFIQIKMKIDNKSYFCYLNQKKYHGMTTCKQKKENY